MNLTDLAKRAARTLLNNSPAILTAAGVTGTLATAYLASRASFKAAVLLQQIEEEASLREKTGRVWKLYIPAGATAALTITSIIFVNRIGSRREAALAAVLSITERAFEEYRTKVVDTLGVKKEEGIRAAIAQDHILANPPSSQIILAGSGDVMCYDEFTGRYFKSNMQSLRKAMNDVNEQVINDSFATLSDFYDRIGLPYTSVSNDVGWNLDKLLTLQFASILSDDDIPCLAINYTVSPVRHFSRLQ